jgi:TrkA family protein
MVSRHRTGEPGWVEDGRRVPWRPESLVVQPAAAPERSPAEGSTVGPPELGVLAVIAVLVVAWGQASQRQPDAPCGLTVSEAPLERLDGSLLVFSVHPGSRLAGISVAELRTPAGGIPAIIHRDGRLLRATDGTLVREGDHLLIAVPLEHRAAVRDRLRAVSRSGRLAGWYGDDGAEPAAPIRGIPAGRSVDRPAGHRATRRRSALTQTRRPSSPHLPVER